MKTATGLSYLFKDLDPSYFATTSFIDKYLNTYYYGSANTMLDVDISSWFAELDTGDSLYY